MKKRVAVLAIALACGSLGAVVLLGQTAATNAVTWAYGFVTTGPDPVPPPCSDTAKPHPCARPGRAWPEDGIQLKLAGSDRTFTIAHIQSYFDPADWYPADHGAVPEVVQHGRESDDMRACAHCHYHNGMGKPENGHLAGLPVDYFMQQMALFKSGGRKSADPRKANAAEMTQTARFLTDAETKAAAEYYASLKWRQPWVRVVESETAPKTRQSPAGLFIPLDGTATEPLGQRIIEVPENPDNTERLRDPHSGFVAYVPVGSIAKGKELVTTGGAGKTLQCAICHGPELKGMGDIPAIADRTASYNMRQLYNYQQGTRQSLLMKQVVEKLTADDMIAIVAYLAAQ